MLVDASHQYRAGIRNTVRRDVLDDGHEIHARPSSYAAKRNRNRTGRFAALIIVADRIERFVHISTSEVYGTAEAALMNEDHALKPLSPYASAKAGRANKTG